MRKIIILLLAVFSMMYADAPNACDVFAADPKNKSNPPNIEGVEFKKLDSTKAIKVCTQAIKDFPNEPRYGYQLGRAYYISDNYQKAFEWYKKAAFKDCALAQDALADMYLFGQNDKDFKVPRDGFIFGKGTQEAYDESLKWYLKAANNGNSSAQMSVAYAYHYAKGVKKDYQEALKWYMKAAEKDSPSGQASVGRMYYNGEGVEKDYKKAFKWLMKAAEQGNVPAQNNIGNMYYEGQGVKKDYKKAFKWYMKAAEKGYSKAQYTIGWMYAYGQWATRNKKKSFKWYTKAAEQGHIVAQKEVATCYLGAYGVKRNTGKALDWYMKAAKQGDGEAKLRVGDMYRASKKDYKKAYEWYLKSAESGYASGQFRMGTIYSEGTMVQKDYKEAYEWFSKAAKQGDVDGMFAIGDMHLRGEGVRKNFNKALWWFRKAVNSGYIRAAWWVGDYYMKGDGFKKNYIKAYAWFSIAQASGDRYLQITGEISKKLSYLESKMTSRQIAIAQSYDPLETKDSTKVQKDEVQSSKTFTGTGFFINTSNVVTNHHVVEECRSIEIVRGEYKTSAKIVVDDSRNDLAVLKAKTPNDTYLKLRAGKSIRIGEEVIVLGYPLGKLLGSGIKLTTGDVSSMTGLVDDATMMQMTAPVQPGNSGGALLDKSGNVVAVVRSRLSKTPSGRSTQNVNLAIKSNILQILLDTKNIDYDVAMSKVKKETADIVDEAKTSVVQVVCHE